MRGSSHSEGSDAFACEYEGTLQSLRSTRADVSAWLRAGECDHEMAERAVLVASELASNAVQAAPGRPYRVTIRRAGESLIELAVSNPFVSTGPPDRARWTPTTPTAPRGRGLSIVEALSRDVRVDVNDHDTDTDHDHEHDHDSASASASNESKVIRVTALLQTAPDK